MIEQPFRHAQQEEFEELLTIPEVANALKVSQVTVRRIIAKDEIATVRVGERHIRIAQSALRSYITTQTRHRTRAEVQGPSRSLAAKPSPPKMYEGRAGKDAVWKVIQADALQGLRALDDNSVNCIVTSPPYYWQRDYGCNGQIGHESTIDGYVNALRDVFSEARRVLSGRGLLFLNIGDTYYSAKGRPHGKDLKNAGRQMARRTLRAVDGPGLGLPRKSLIGIPWRVAIALQEDGWTLRSDIIWERPGCLGEPTARDRPWRTYEHIFMFARSPRYHFSREALDGNEDIWTFPARPDNPAYHFAPYPLELVTRCLAIGCPEDGTVLDPFVGSGTTMVAALQTGRSAIGIDLHPDYCTHALRWITDRSANEARATPKVGRAA